MAHFMLLLWSWPHRLRGSRFHDLNFYWRSATGYDGPGTSDAVDQVLKPDTALAQSSLAELHMPGPAHTFVSHSWQLNVKELFVALARSFAGLEMLRLWMAVFSVNHWRPISTTPAESCCHEVLKSRSCQCVALVLGGDAQSLKRLWCLYEVFAAVNSERQMSLKLCSPQGLLSVGTGGMPVSYILKVSNGISKLDFSDASCQDFRTKTRLLQELNRHGGSERCTPLLRSFLTEGLSAMHRRGHEIFLQASKLDTGGTPKSDIFDDRSETAAEDSESPSHRKSPTKDEAMPDLIPNPNESRLEKDATNHSDSDLATKDDLCLSSAGSS
eukprot:symbB.v1.2.037947.t1/scaffold5750.1/size24005/1